MEFVVCDALQSNVITNSSVCPSEMEEDVFAGFQSWLRICSMMLHDWAKECRPIHRDISLSYLQVLTTDK